MKLNGCIVSLLIIGAFGLLIMAGCSSIIGSLADWRQSANAVSLAQEQTNWVRLHEEHSTRRAEIAWGAQIELANIKADTTKKTSIAFTIFYLTRYLAWIALPILIILWRGQQLEQMAVALYARCKTERVNL